MDANIPAGIILGFIAWFLLRYLAGGFYTVDQNERAVKSNLDAPIAFPEPPPLTIPSPRALTLRKNSATSIRRFA